MLCAQGRFESCQEFPRRLRSALGLWSPFRWPHGLRTSPHYNPHTLGTRPTMSHVTAQLEVQGLLASLLAAPSQAAEGFDQANAA